MPKPLTPSERLVGRRIPALPKHLDVLMAGYLRDDGTACGRLTPGESWLRPAHRQARRNGWIRAGGAFGLGAGKPVSLWYPTESGLIAAREARARVTAAHQARAEWALDFRRAHLQAGNAEPSGETDLPSP